MIENNAHVHEFKKHETFSLLRGNAADGRN